MKRKLIGAALAAVVLMILFAACSDEPQLVAWQPAKSVAAVTPEQTTDKYYVLIKWDAIEDGTNYQVYVQEEGKKTVYQFGGGQNSNIYSPTTGFPSIPNTDRDKWSKIISVEYTITGTTYTDGELPNGKKYRFGVVTEDIKPSHSSSEIKWSDYISVAAPPPRSHSYY